MADILLHGTRHSGACSSVRARRTGDWWRLQIVSSCLLLVGLSASADFLGLRPVNLPPSTDPTLLGVVGAVTGDNVPNLVLIARGSGTPGAFIGRIDADAVSDIAIATFPVTVNTGTPGDNGSPRIFAIAGARDGGAAFSFFTTSTGRTLDGVGYVDPSGHVTTTVVPSISEGFKDSVFSSNRTFFGVEEFANRVDRADIAADGTATITQFTIPTTSSRPEGIAVAADGSLWITESNSGKIAHMTPQGMFTEFNAPGLFPNPTAITTGQNGMWFTDKFGESIDFITPTGMIIQYPVPSVTRGDLTSIAVGPDKNLWFIEHESRKIGRFLVSSATPDGHAQIDTMSIPDSAPGQPFKIGFAGPKIAVIGGDRNNTFLLLGDVQVAPPPPAGTPDLVVKKEHRFDEAFNPESVLNYTFSITNIGTAPTTGPIRLKDTFPTGFRFNPTREVSGCDYNAFSQTLTCTIDAVIQPGGAYMVTAVGVVDDPSGSVLNNQASVSGGGETNTANDDSNIDTFTLARPNLQVTKEYGTDQLNGKRWRITVKNVGIVPTSGAVNSDRSDPVRCDRRLVRRTTWRQVLSHRKHGYLPE